MVRGSRNIQSITKIYSAKTNNGNWNEGANSGSRNSNWNNAPSNSNNNIGSRGVSDDTFYWLWYCSGVSGRS